MQLDVRICCMLTLCAACGSGTSDDVVDAREESVDASAPISSELGGLTVELHEVPAQIIIKNADGDVILSGLPGGTGTDAPEIAAAFRTSDDVWQSAFGAYRPLEDPGDWQGVTRFSDIEVGTSAITFAFSGDIDGTGEIRETAEGVLRVELAATDQDRATLAFSCNANEHFLGFGAMAMDVDHRGHAFPIFVSEQGNGRVDTEEYADNWFIRGTRHQASFAVPFFLSSRGYGVLADTTRRTYFSMCAESEDSWRLEAWDTEVAFYLFYGPTPYEVIKRHSDLVGRPPVPPAFAFAPWNDAVGGSAEVRRVANVLRSNDIPSSAIWTEDWAGSSGTAERLFLDHNWTVSRALYPDFETVAGELHDAGFKFLGYFSAFAYEDMPSEGYTSDHYQEGKDHGYFVTREADGEPASAPAPRLPLSVVVTDLTNSAAVDWMVGYMDAAMDAGLDGWMADYGEWMPIDGVTAGTEDPLAYHNRYPVEWQKANQRALADRTDGVERLVFVRSGFTGSQAIDTQVVWGADQATDFGPEDGIPTTIPIGLGLGVVGMPFYGPDIAGYAEWSSTNEGLTATGVPSTKELWFRWAALGALMPIMRTHHGRNAAENWNFERDAETIEHFKRWARMHVQLFPYFMALAHEAADTGRPLMRAMGLEFPTDDTVWNLTDQYMLGPQLLVAPVVTAGATSRSVYLPEGDWLPLDGGSPEVGPMLVTADAPLSELPVYARAGTVLALLPATVETLVSTDQADVVDLGDVGDDREVRAYLGASGSFTETDSSLSYALTHDHSPGTGASLEWNATAVAACDAGSPTPPCGDVDEVARVATAQVTGDGTLTLVDGDGTAATLQTAGGTDNRTLTLRLYW